MPPMNRVTVKVFLLALCSVIAFLCCQRSTYSQELEYEIIAIHREDPNDLSIVPRAINDKSEVTGYIIYAGEGDGTHLPFIWRDNNTELLPFSGINANTFDINNNSWVTGEVVVQTGETEYDIAVLPVIWEPGSGYRIIPLPSGYERGRGTAINDNNVVVGYMSNSYVSYAHPFVYNGTVQIIPVYTECDDDEAEYQFKDINNSGVAIGYGSCGGTNYEWFIWEDGLKTNIYAANAINNNNQIAAVFGGSAVLYTENIPYVFDKGDYLATTTTAINDAGVMVGNATKTDGQSTVVMYVDEQIIDLNTFVPLDSNIVIYGAVDINNRGEILISGYYKTDPPKYAVAFILRPKSISITYPTLNKKFISGSPDTIRWSGGNEGQSIDLEYTLDDGITYHPVNSAAIDAEDGKYGWDVPDTLLCMEALIHMLDHDTGDTLAASDTFRIKPYVITRMNDDDEYVAYDFAIDRWGFGNIETQVWPHTWWQQFNYQASIDTVTGSQYSQIQGWGVFSTALSYEFPDWPSFVRTFGIDACYLNTTLGIYSPTALARWDAIKEEWGGSCYGIAAANALAFEKRNEFNSAHPSFPSFTDPVTVPATAAVIPVVSELFTHQYGNPHRSNTNFRRDSIGPSATVTNLKMMLSEDNTRISTLMLFNNHGDGGHCVVPYKVEQDADFDWIYYIDIWDNSYPNNQNAKIIVDTSANGGDGSWQTTHAFLNWGGEKYLFLNLYASDYLTNPSITKPTMHEQVFATEEGYVEISRPHGTSYIITDELGNRMGSGESEYWNEIPDAIPLIVANGSETPPYGYQLPSGEYTVEISDFTDESANVFFFTGSNTFAYRRSDMTPDQTDQLIFDGGLSFKNPDDEIKIVNLMYIDNQGDQEIQYAINGLTLTPDDSVHVEPDAEDRLTLKSFGDATSYNVVVGSVSEDGLDIFEHVSVPLPSNTSHILMPDWTDDAGDQLKILIDTGNDGSVDDSLQVENQTLVEEQTAQAAPSGFRLNGNYPNPFNPTTTISYELPSQSPVIITIYTATGQLIQSYDIGMQSAGMQEFLFDGSGLPSGVYLYRIETGSAMRTGRMLLMK